MNTELMQIAQAAAVTKTTLGRAHNCEICEICSALNHNGSCCIEFALDEVVEHLQSYLRLVHGNHVASLEDLHEMEALGRSQATSFLTLHLVILVLSRIEV